MVTKLVSFGRKIVPKGLRPKVGLLYYKLQNLIKYGTFDMFHTVELQTLTACNRRCSYCPVSTDEKGLLKNNKMMKTEVFHKIIDELASIRFGGLLSPHLYGEPFLDKRLPELMSYARKRLPKANIGIHTNGDLLTISLYEKLAEAGVDSLTISQHGKSMPRAVKKIFEYRKKNNDNRIEIFYKTITDETPLWNRGGLISHPVIMRRRTCFYATKTMTIDYLGNVIICCQDYYSTVKFGNVEKESMMHIWKKPGVKKLRKDLREGKFNLKLCKDCSQGV